MSCGTVERHVLLAERVREWSPADVIVQCMHVKHVIFRLKIFDSMSDMYFRVIALYCETATARAISSCDNPISIHPIEHHLNNSDKRLLQDTKLYCNCQRNCQKHLKMNKAYTHAVQKLDLCIFLSLSYIHVIFYKKEVVDIAFA